jgi:hypothetical protein
MLGIKGTETSQPSFAIPGETVHPPRRDADLPTFTLEKLVPGGIAEVSP